MKNPEEAIDKVLAGLRSAEVPTGMEGRILGALEERAAARAGFGWRFWQVLPGGPVGARYLACGVALAGLFAIALAVPAIRQITRPVAQTKVKMAAAKPGLTSAVATDMKTSPANRARPLLHTPGMRVVNMIAPEAGAAESSDEIARSEMLAPSHPAPPMPLTDQERLLMRLVRRSDQVELAMLESKLDALKDAEEKADFQRFFAQPVTVQPTIDDPGAKQVPQGQTQPEPTPPAQSQPDQQKLEHSTTGDNK